MGENNFFVQVFYSDFSTEIQQIPLEKTFTEMKKHFEKLLFLKIDHITKIFLQDGNTKGF